LTSLLASIPSPSEGAIHIGPLQLRAYGLMIALGVVAAVWLSGRRFVQKGIGTQEDVTYIAMWAVPAGVIGSRLYHVITDWNTFEGHWLDVFKIWQGGLGIWGGIAVGVPVGVWAAHRRHIPLDAGLAAVTPALPLAQAIGRWGNWWNQELFGRPTTLPWALRISPDKTIAAGYPPGTTFQPTFLYESLWNLLLCGALLWIDKRYRPRGIQLFAMYVAGYTFMRFWIERMRIDFANHIGGWRVNEVVSLVVFVVAVAFLIWSYRTMPPPAPLGGAAADLGVTAAAADERIPTGSGQDDAVASDGVSDGISPSAVAHVALLARLQLAPDELELYTAQLGSMLDHFRDIDALDLADVPPMTQPLPLANVFRDDVVGPTLDRDEVLAAAPQAEAGRFRVPPILGEAP
jgi:prolipoprotein diacylglyceryl transferase/aspartyl/glutamyl-tRNA(Asn/Gln) amidotransferase C subunit